MIMEWITEQNTGTIIIEDNLKSRKFIQEWLGDRAELVDVSDIDEIGE